MKIEISKTIYIVFYTNEYGRTSVHSVWNTLVCAENMVKIESNKYPFCHYGSFEIQEWESK